MPLTPVSSSNYYSVIRRPADRETIIQEVDGDEKKNDIETKETISPQLEQIEAIKQIIANNNIIVDILEKSIAEFAPYKAEIEKELTEMREGRDPLSIEIAHMGRNIAEIEKELTEMREGRDPLSIEIALRSENTTKLQKEITEDNVKIAYIDKELAALEIEVRSMLEQVKLQNQVIPQNDNAEKEVLEHYQSIEPVKPTPANISVFEPTHISRLDLVSEESSVAFREIEAASLRNGLQKYMLNFFGTSQSNNTIFFKGWF